VTRDLLVWCDNDEHWKEWRWDVSVSARVVRVVRGIVAVHCIVGDVWNLTMYV